MYDWTQYFTKIGATLWRQEYEDSWMMKKYDKHDYVGL